MSNSLQRCCKSGNLGGVIAACASDPSAAHLNTSKLGLPPLLTACQNGHLPVVEYLLSLPEIDPGVCDVVEHATVFHKAVQAENLPLVRFLLTHPRITCQNQQDVDGRSPFWVACMQKNLQIIRLLAADPRIRPNIPNTNGATGLYLACQTGTMPVVELLVGLPEVDVNQGRNDGANPLYIACQNGHVNVVSLLLRQPAIRPNTRVAEGATAFFIACQKGHLDVISVFLADPRISPTIPMADGTTPLSIAIGFGHTQVVELLLATCIPLDLSSCPAISLSEALKLDLLTSWLTLLRSTKKTLISSRDVALARGIPAIVRLLDSYAEDPRGTRARLLATSPTVRRHLQPAKEVFCLVVFLADGLLQLRPETARWQNGEEVGVRRFFRLALRLPLEMQTTLCCRVFGLAREVLPAQELEPVFRLIVRKFELEQQARAE